MKKKQMKLQLLLISIGFFLFMLTYLYYPNLNKNESIDQFSKEKELEKINNEDQGTTFENVEYKGVYDFDKQFIVKSKEAHILSEDPDIVYMKNMHVILYLSDNRKVEITSLKGSYNKVNYNCYFQDNVFASDGQTKISAKNLDMLATENFVQIYNNVNLSHPTGSLMADKIDYNFETKNFKVSMFNEKRIKMRVTQ